MKKTFVFYMACMLMTWCSLFAQVKPSKGSVTYDYPEGKVLSSDRKVAKGEMLSLAPMGVQIVAER